MLPECHHYGDARPGVDCVPLVKLHLSQLGKILPVPSSPRDLTLKMISRAMLTSVTKRWPCVYKDLTLMNIVFAADSG